MSKGSIDLHSHTIVSDGSLTPEQLVAEAKRKELSALAITDHDRLAAIEPARLAASGSGLEIIPGVEVSTASKGFTLHILGLFVGLDHAGFNQYLEELYQARIRRVETMVERLASIKIHIPIAEVCAEAKGTVGRNHVASVLLKHGFVATRKEAFERYLVSGKPGFVPYEKSEPQDAIAMIRQAGGRSFLAHPGLVRNQELIHELIRLKIDGLEVIHPEHSPTQVKRYQQVCLDHGLLQSGGSDYHGPNMERKGDLGEMGVSPELLEAIRRSL